MYACSSLGALLSSNICMLPGVAGLQPFAESGVCTYQPGGRKTLVLGLCSQQVQFSAVLVPGEVLCCGNSMMQLFTAA
jgi:3-hydroxymyristoyl/3-hydroxydecanoyl-(acyl carrier protein) dehydratase